jgi:2OG-Fe(II) oxygenase superfamily
MGKNRKRKRPQQQQQPSQPQPQRQNLPARNHPKNKRRIPLPHNDADDDDDDEEGHSSCSLHDDDDNNNKNNTSNHLDGTDQGGVVDEISQDDLEITIATLERLGGTGSGHSSMALSEKRFKRLRRALHPLVVQQLQSYQQGTDYRIKVTQYLAIQQWSDAMAALRGCRDWGQIPKQGTVQRWVRDCDACVAAPCKLQLLNAILTLVNPSIPTTTTTSVTNTSSEDATPSTTTTATTTNTELAVSIEDKDSKDRYMNRHDPHWVIRVLEQQQPQTTDQDDAGKLASSSPKTTTPAPPVDLGIDIMPDWSLGRLMTSSCNTAEEQSIDWDNLPTVQLQSRILYRESALERTPPNHYDLLLHTTTEPGSIRWSESPPTIVKHAVPFLESQKGDAFVLEHVLTVEECQQLRAAATQLGWRPDHPTSLDQSTGIDSCEWLVDDSISSVLSDRVRPYLPHLSGENRGGVTASVVPDGGVGSIPAPRPSPLTAMSGTTRFHAINPRWRFFRYGPQCVYRPHIDGSWPASRIDADGQYECYSHDRDGGTIKSYHTFLIYLNDNFQGGQTRFYVPKGDGTLVAHGVAPKCGSVLVFSQGNTASLLHEGAAVTHGQKFVIRTDVLYQTPPCLRHNTHTQFKKTTGGL